MFKTPSTKEITDKFIAKIRQKLDDNLRAVILYGSAARGEFHQKISDINLLVAVKASGAQALNDISAINRQSAFQKISALVLTKEEIENSTDVFPIEFLDMKESYAVLYGEDIFQNLGIDLKNLRHQCEGELKSKIIRMRQFFIRNSNDAGAIKRFLLKIAPSITVVLKNILRLKNINIRPTESLAQKIVAELGLSTNALAIMLEMRAKGLCSKSAKALLEDVLLELQQISSVLDKM